MCCVGDDDPFPVCIDNADNHAFYTLRGQARYLIPHSTHSLYLFWNVPYLSCSPTLISMKTTSSGFSLSCVEVLMSPPAWTIVCVR